MIPTAFIPLANHLWQSTLFAAVAGLLTLALRRNQARVCYWLWMAASFKFLLPFSWLVSIGHRFAWHAAPKAMPPVVVQLSDAVSGPLFLSSFPAANPAPNHAALLPLLIWAVLAGGCTTVALGWIRQWLRVRTVVWAASPLPLGLPIPVVSTSERLEPGVFGIFRPVLLLPEGIATRLTPPQLQALLAHELCHVRRRDNLTAAIQMLVEAVFWFHPLVWWIETRLVTERERACDEAVLQSGSEPQAYAEGILSVCEFYLESPLTCVSGITGSALRERIQRIMKERVGVPLTAQKKLLLATAAAMALSVPIVAGVLKAPQQLAQAPAVSPGAQSLEAMEAAGVKMSFDVASVKLNKSGGPAHTNVAMSPHADYSPTGGLFLATNFRLQTYLAWAYDLPGYEALRLLDQYPPWALADRFDIEARAQGNPTKAQMQLMMQSLLAYRFKLVVHTETKQGRVYALVLSKPGKTGPQLHPHSNDGSCSTPVARPSSVVASLPPCAVGFINLQATAAGNERLGGRKLTMQQIAEFLPAIGDSGVDRPVFDHTELRGTFDFIIEFERLLPTGAAPNVEQDESGPAFLEALQDQLGLKLESTTGPVDVLVVDHVEQPSEN